MVPKLGMKNALNASPAKHLSSIKDSMSMMEACCASSVTHTKSVRSAPGAIKALLEKGFSSIFGVFHEEMFLVHRLWQITPW